MNIIRKGLVMVGGTVITTMFRVLQGVLIARILGPEGTGQFQFVISISLMISAWLIFGMRQANIFYLNHHKASLSHILLNSIYFCAFLGGLAAIIVYLILHFGHTYTGWLSFPVRFIFSFSVIFLFFDAIIKPILIAQMRVFEYNVALIVSKGLPVFLMGFLALLGVLTTGKALVVISIAQILGVFITLFFLQAHRLETLVPDLKLLWTTLKYGLQLYIVNLLMTIDQRMGMVLIGIFMPGELNALGYYSRAVAICTLIRLIAQSLSNLLYSHWASVDEIRRVRQAERVLRICTLLCVILIVGILLAGKWLLVGLYGKAFLPGYAPLQLLVVQQSMWMLSKVFQMFFSGSGTPMLTVYNLTIINTISVGGMIMLIPRNGIMGVAIALTLAHIVYVGLNFLQARKHFNLIIYRCFIVNYDDMKFLFKRLIKR